MENISYTYGTIFIITGAILFGIALVIQLFKLYSGKLPYIKQPNGLFSAAEKKFYFMLMKSLNYEYTIFAKVRIADIIAVAPHAKGPNEIRAFNKISRKHVDYVICNKKTLDIMAVVELDDSSHLRKDRMDRDKFVDKVFVAAGIPLLHVKVQNHYDLRLLENLISQAIYKN